MFTSPILGSAHAVAGALGFGLALVILLNERRLGASLRAANVVDDLRKLEIRLVPALR